MISQCIYKEVLDGRGIEQTGAIGEDYVYLNLMHLGREEIQTKLPEISDFATTYLGIKPWEEPVPVMPTAHYIMGGIPTDNDGRVKRNAQGDLVEGLYAAGECACVSVHGANRLGTNSLRDLVVFGRRVGLQGAKNVDSLEVPKLPDDADGRMRGIIDRLKQSDGTERMGALRNDLAKTMMVKASVRRTKESLTEAREDVRELRRRFDDLALDDKGEVFNSELLEALELGYMLDFSLVQIEGALVREESRGAHLRLDGPDGQAMPRDDDNWLKHTYAWLDENGEVTLDYGEVYLLHRHPEDGWDQELVERFKPKERKY